MDNDEAALLICPQIMSGLLILKLNFITNRFFQCFFEIVDFLFLKNSNVGFSLKALETRTNLPIFSSEIAAAKFLLLSIGSMITIDVLNFFEVFPRI